MSLRFGSGWLVIYFLICSCTLICSAPPLRARDYTTFKKTSRGSELWCSSLPSSRNDDAVLHAHASGSDVGHQPVESVLPETTARQPGEPDLYSLPIP